MTCTQVAVATSHRQICAVVNAGPDSGSGGDEAEAIILPSADTSRQLMLLVCCIMCLHEHHTTATVFHPSGPLYCHTRTQAYINL